ncbi:transglycosylase SLT domain-containing protein [Candidatus Uhrbacteria bacterium]|nr:MAG: transglycosylase SLT domain-containing protein [Candidatus Uhrbacteria bacterium]
MRPWISLLFISVSVFAGLASVASAQDVLILQMKDGSFYNPTSGKAAPTREALLQMLGASSVSSTLVTPDPIVIAPEPVLPPLIAAIDKGQAMLRDEIAAQGLQGRIRGPVIGQDAPREVTLAVWDKETGNTDLVRGVKKGKELVLTSPSPSNISIKRSNWINSDYQSEDPTHLVVAVRYPIHYEIKEGKKVIAYETEQVVYTPYSTTLHQPEIIARGKKVVDDLIANALTDLRTRGIKSRAQPDKLVADVIDTELLTSIAVIEHTDSSALRRDPAAAVERVYATIGLNPGVAYNYSRSSAGALGLFQFIPSTYNSLAKQGYGLKQNFEDGMRDHENAMKAAAIYMDIILSQFPADVRAANTNFKTFEYIAAGYNGGYGRVRRAIQIWEDQINGVLKPHEILRRARLQPETIDYVKKLRNALPVLRQDRLVRMSTAPVITP